MLSSKKNVSFEKLIYVKRMLEKNPQLRGYYEGNKEEVE